MPDAPPPRTPILSVRGLAVTFPRTTGPVRAVRGIDFEIFANEVVCIVGESGSGKSVTALAACGLLPENAIVQGSIRLGAVDVARAPEETLRRMRGEDVGYIFQDPTTTLNPVLPIWRQITDGQVAHGRLSRREARPRAVALLRDVEIPDSAPRATQYPHQFSGGMRQRAVIAMAMAGRPQLIIADEPTTALDVTVQAQVLDMLARRRAETGAAMILITHDLGVVAENADRVLVMYGGRIVESGPVERIFRAPRHPYTVALLRSMPRLDGASARLDPIPGQPPSPADLPSGCVFHPRCALGRDRPRCAEEEPTLRTVGAEQSAACHYADEVATVAARPRAASETRRDTVYGEELLRVEDLRVHFPIRTGLLRRQTALVRAVDGVTFGLRAGETLGLVGESGCGKTTTGRAIMGLIRTSGGRVIVGDQETTHLSRRALRPVRRQMQYVFQDPFSSLNPMLTVAEIIAEPMRIHGIHAAMGGGQRVATLLDMVGLARSHAGRFAHEFSGGQKQRIGIARALALAPRVLILDEPVAALDVSIQAQIVNLLQELQQELGLAYLFIAHDLSVVRHVSDRIAVMYLGRIVEESDRRTLYATPMHPYTQSLLSAVPQPDPELRRGKRRIVLQGEVPSPARLPSGCAFHPRCFRASGRCRIETPVLARCADTGTICACHHAGPLERPAQLAAALA